MPSSDPNSTRTESGFISRNYDEATLEATFHFIQQAAIPREISFIWNVIPGWNGTIKITDDELRKGAACATELTDVLPALRSIVFVEKGNYGFALSYPNGISATLVTPSLTTRKSRTPSPMGHHPIHLGSSTRVLVTRETDHTTQAVESLDFECLSAAKMLARPELSLPD